MKSTILFLMNLFFCAIVGAQESNFQGFYVGAYTSEGARGISYCQLNLSSGEINLVHTIKGVDNPSFLKISPNKKYLYAVSEVRSEAGRSGGAVLAYRINKNGSLDLINRQSSNGDGPCHVDVSPDGKFVAVATYSAGTTSLYSVGEDGALSEATSVIVNTGSGPNKARQKNPHAHSIKFGKDGNWVFSADLGTDQLNIFTLEGNNLKTSGQESVAMKPGAGPRHFDFHPKADVIYVINELNSSIETVEFDKGVWKTVGSVSTLPADFEGSSYCADIHVSKDGSFVYGSNRGHNSIATFGVADDGYTLAYKGAVSVEGDWPRNFGITPDGEWMLVANQKSHTITVFKINRKTGMPEFIGKKYELPSPVCIEFW